MLGISLIGAYQGIHLDLFQVKEANYRRYGQKYHNAEIESMKEDWEENRENFELKDAEIEETRIPYCHYHPQTIYPISDIIPLLKELQKYPKELQFIQELSKKRQV